MRQMTCNRYSVKTSYGPVQLACSGDLRHIIGPPEELAKKDLQRREQTNPRT
jgi:hypothetical protein